jgi:hypothetical protein
MVRYADDFILLCRGQQEAQEGLGKCPVTEEIGAVLRKIEYWHQGAVAKFKIMRRDGKDFGKKFNRTAKTFSRGFQREKASFDDARLRRPINCSNSRACLNSLYLPGRQDRFHRGTRILCGRL